MKILFALLFFAAQVFAQSSGLPSTVPGTVGNCVKIGTNNVATDNGSNCASGSSALSVIQTLTPTGTGTVTFSSLGAFKDLIVVVRGASTVAATNSEIHVQFNGDTGANYDQENITVNNAGLASAQTLAGNYIFAGWVPGTTGVANMGTGTECTIYDYAGTTFQKSMETIGGVKLANALISFYTTKNTGWWRSTAAITSVTVFLAAGNYATGSSVSLYGRN